MADDSENTHLAETIESSIESKDPSMQVKVYAPFHIYFEGEALSVSAVNDIGPFDILPKHRNFLCMLVPSVVSIKTIKNETKQIKINRALMHVKADFVSIFVDV